MAKAAPYVRDCVSCGRWRIEQPFGSARDWRRRALRIVSAKREQHGCAARAKCTREYCSVVGDCELFPEGSGLKRRENQQRLCSVKWVRLLVCSFGGFRRRGLFSTVVLSAARSTHNSKLQQTNSPLRLDVQIARPPLHSELAVEFGVVGFDC